MVRQLLRQAFDGPDKLLNQLAKRGTVVHFKCVVVDAQVVAVEVSAVTAPLQLNVVSTVLGRAERQPGESFAEPLRALAEQVRAQLKLGYL